MLGDAFFKPDTSEEAAFRLEIEPTVTLLPDGTFRIEGWSLVRGKPRQQPESGHHRPCAQSN